MIHAKLARTPSNQAVGLSDSQGSCESAVADSPSPAQPASVGDRAKIGDCVVDFAGPRRCFDSSMSWRRDWSLIAVARRAALLACSEDAVR